MTTTYYTASSLDGFVVDTDDSLSWLLSRDIDPDGPFGHHAFEASVGALVMGAETYRWIRREEPDAWPYAQPTWLFTHSDPVLPPGADVRVVSGDVADHHAAIVESAGDRPLWLVGGGRLAAQWIDAGLVDELVVAYAPCTLGAGAPVAPVRSEWTLAEVARNGDFVCARWTSAPPAASHAQ